MLTLGQKVLATAVVLGMNLAVLLFGGVLVVLTLVPSLAFLLVLLRR
jgi:hypothetical protein